jgi:hypothetical protein
VVHFLRRSAPLIAASALVTGLTAAAQAADAASAAAGSYVALAKQSRVVDTRTGAAGNHRGALRAGQTIAVRVAGVGALPSTGVGSVVVTVTALRPTGTGSVVLYGASAPRTSNLSFAAGGAPVTDTAVVPLSAGRMHIRNTAARGAVQLTVDVSGYYRAGTPSARRAGIFHILGTARRVVTLRPHAHASVTTAIGGRAGVPSGAGAAAVTLTVSGATRSGTLLGHRPDEPKQNLPLVRFAAGRAVSSFAVVRLSGGRTTLVNTSAASVRISVDVAGWYTIGFAQSAQAFQTVVQTRVATTHLSGASTVTLKVAGRGGVPLRHAAAVLITLQALSPSASGFLQAWQGGLRRPRTTAVLGFSSGQSASNVVMVPVSRDGRIAVHNTSKRATDLAVDVDGYVPATTLPNPAATATARYVRNISGAPSDAATMQAEGAADAAAGYSFVLLDIGAQANDRTGVVLSGTSTELTYAQLRAAIQGYLTGFATGGHTGQVAVGTNNSGNDWTTYPASDRGADWATEVVVPLANGAPSGITVIGANDLEAGFFSTEPQAEAWKAAFLNHVPGAGTALVYNGSADFCPTTWRWGARCNFGWTETKLYGLAGGSRTVVLPQIYFGYMATQWAMINKTGGGGLHFLGALTQYAMDHGSLRPAQGWAALQRAMSSVTTEAIGNQVADIHT